MDGCEVGGELRRLTHGAMQQLLVTVTTYAPLPYHVHHHALCRRSLDGTLCCGAAAFKAVTIAAPTPTTIHTCKLLSYQRFEQRVWSRLVQWSDRLVNAVECVRRCLILCPRGARLWLVSGAAETGDRRKAQPPRDRHTDTRTDAPLMSPAQT